VTGSTRAMAILIVEDNERNLKLVRDILQYNGYETIEARNAADGVALAAEHRPDLILMDIQLPDADGVTALSRLRADPRTASIAVVALTAFAMTDDRQRLLAAGFDGYLAKPIDVRAFPGEVLALLQSTRLEGSE
jgi:two-component system cell cycle response regulator DivK